MCESAACHHPTGRRDHPNQWESAPPTSPFADGTARHRKKTAGSAHSASPGMSCSSTASTLCTPTANALLRRSVSQSTHFPPTRHDIPHTHPPHTLRCQE
ncbi:unnamed protein product [Ectocarpus sp. 12 AP-2014]